MPRGLPSAAGAPTGRCERCGRIDFGFGVYRRRPFCGRMLCGSCVTDLRREGAFLPRAAAEAAQHSIGRWGRHDSGLCSGCGKHALTLALNALDEAIEAIGRSKPELATEIIRAARRPILDTRAAFRYAQQPEIGETEGCE